MNEQEQNYVIWLEFDDEYTDFLNEKCNELDENKIAPGIRPPHLTLTFVKTKDQERLVEFTKTFIQKNKIKLAINSIAQFSGGVLYYAPKVTMELLKFHSDYCQGLTEFGELTWNLYYPGNWTPHIALTGELDDEAASKAFTIMRKGFSERNVAVKRVMVRGNGETIYLPV